MTDLNKFVQDAIRTEALIPEVVVNTDILRGTIQLLIAAGNILDMIKKDVFYGKTFQSEPFLRQYALAHQGLAKLAAIPDNKESINVDPRLFHAVVGIATESVELLEALNKILDGADPDTVNFKEELGDLNWYEAIAIDTLDLSFEEVLNTVIAKLKARYPEKFSADAAINRNLNTERKVLEGQNEEI